MLKLKLLFLDAIFTQERFSHAKNQFENCCHDHHHHHKPIELPDVQIQGHSKYESLHHVNGLYPICLTIPFRFFDANERQSGQIERSVLAGVEDAILFQ